MKANGYKIAPYANLIGADLEGADLQGAYLYEADLGANLERANLERANLGGVIWDKSTIWPEGFTPPDA